MVQARPAGVNGVVAPCSSERRITVCGPRRIQLHLHYGCNRIRDMPMLLRILAAFRAGQFDQAGLLSRVQALAAEPKADVAALIETLQADHRKAPLPAPVFAAVLRQLQTSTDKTLLRTRDAALDFILGNTGAHDPRTGDIVWGIRLCVMQAVVRGPGQGRTRAIEEGQKDQALANDGMESQRPVGEGSMIAHGRT